MLDLICVMLLASPIILVVALIGLAALWFVGETDAMTDEGFGYDYLNRRS